MQTMYRKKSMRVEDKANDIIPIPQDERAKLVARLRAAGLRVTEPRLALARMLFSGGNRHVTAETLHKQVRQAGLSISLATIYNSLHQFMAAGFLWQIVVDANHSYFDTNIHPHHHFFITDENRLIDIPADDITITNLPDIPDGLEMGRVDVIIRVNHATPQAD